MIDIDNLPIRDTSFDLCPKCGSNLAGELIPVDKRHLFGATHFSRKIGIYSLEKDMTVEYECPDCKETWDRE